jgi:glycosyltransferase involved in cell wall biosynthesis
MKHPLYFQWGISTLFGWGVYGLNLLRHWQKVSGSPAYCIGQIQLESLSGMDPLSLLALAQPLVDSDQMRLKVAARAGQPVRLDGIVLHSLGNQFSGPVLPRNGGVTGEKTCAAIFFEDTRLPDPVGICSDYDLIVTGSRWCEEVLRAKGVSNVATVIQGIDPATFHPAPKSGALEGRFAIFSGGKMEHRKAQDLVLLAFRAFARRHPEALLVTAWHSPWPVTALTINGNPAIQPVRLTAAGQIDLAAWVSENGVAENQFLDVGAIPNHLMARVVREMDVALFPNRCEGGTNLVAMECMACGIPTILSDNTGHKDLTATGASFPLIRQGAVISGETGTEGWGESDVDEIVEMLETVWANREAAKKRGQEGAEALAKLSWRNQIDQLHRTLSGLVF